MVIIAGGVLGSGACCIPAVFGGIGRDREWGFGCIRIGGRTGGIVGVHRWEVIRGRGAENQAIFPWRKRYDASSM